jgi:hypothetical protein
MPETKNDFMKKVVFKKGVAWFLLGLIFPLINFAQDKKIDIDINKKDSSWYTQSWVWIVGAAVFVLLLVALLRGGRRTD